MDLSIDPSKLEPYKRVKLDLIYHVLRALYKSDAGSNYTLKGGTALLLCYGLDRFSEDIDLDGVKKVQLDASIRQGCKASGLPCKVTRTKDTDSVLRYMIHFDENSELPHPLKIEASFRNSKLLAANSLSRTNINGIQVYSLDTLISMKIGAFQSRDAIRDFYDVCWFLREHQDRISQSQALQLYQSITEKGFDDLVELLKEEAFEDHILRESDIESLALQMMENLEKVIAGGNTRTMNLFNPNN